MKCICGKEFGTMRSLASHKARCSVYQKLLFDMLEDIRNRGILERWFRMKSTSLRLCELLNKRYPGYGFNVSKIISYCRQNHISTPSIKEGNNSPRVRKIRHEQNNLAKGTPGYKKRNETVLKKYGVSNVFQLDSVKNKIRETMLSKYGVSCPNFLPWYKPNNGTISKPHKRVCDYLNSIGYKEGIDYETESPHKFEKFNEQLNSNFCPRPDILIESRKLVIEIYGDRWHGNPDIYKDDEIIHTWYGDITPVELRKRDKIREDHIKSFGYQVAILWETDVKNDNFIQTLEQYGISKNLENTKN